jgi:hypothetical protein
MFGRSDVAPNLVIFKGVHTITAPHAHSAPNSKSTHLHSAPAPRATDKTNRRPIWN